ncbi:MAG: efflux RND transporter periplasmic adaptor subunit [Bacteroidota bacterium]
MRNLMIHKSHSLFNLLIKHTKTLILICTIILAGCGNKASNVQKEEEHGHEEGHENETTVSLSNEQIKTIGLQFGSIEKKQLTSTLKANGILKVPNEHRATITAMAAGVVKSILVQPGRSVVKGQVIATIAGTSFITLQEEYISVSAKAALAESDFNRQKELQQGNATAMKTFQQSESELKSFKARKSSLQKQLELIGINTSSLTSDNINSYVNIVSPIDGSVSEVNVNIGSFVESNNPIATIIDNSQLHLDLYVYEKDLSKLREGQIIHFTLTNNQGINYDAKVFAISNTFETNTKAVAVHAKVLGSGKGLIDGMSISAIVSLNDVTVDAVPSEAIVSSEGQDFIFVVTDEHNENEHITGDKHSEEDGHNHDEHGHSHEEAETANHKEEKKSVAGKGEHANEDASKIIFERIPVAKGTTDVGYSEITLLKDIPENAKVITKGAFFVLSKMTNSGEGHAH